ncbi:hypothetical protein ACFLYF_06855, partial [Chloroflexota bacterium]
MARDSEKQHPGNGELTGKQVGSGTQVLATTRRPIPTPRTLIRRIMPPLASSVWPQLSRVKEESNRITGWITERVIPRLQLSRVTRPLVQPVLKSAFSKERPISNVWQRALNLDLFRKRWGQPAESSLPLNSAIYRRLLSRTREYEVNDVSQIPDFSSREKLVGAGDEVYAGDVMPIPDVIDKEPVPGPVDEKQFPNTALAP